LIRQIAALLFGAGKKLKILQIHNVVAC
jgi:hypothetical protein